MRIYRKFHVGGPGCIRIGKNCVVDGIPGDTSHHTCIDAYYPTTVVTIGDNVCLRAARIGARFEISVGNEVLIEESGVIDTDFHSIDRKREDPAEENIHRCRVVIGNRVSIGARSIIMKGVTIGEEAVVVPGSVVVASVKPKLLVCGNPARPMYEDNLRTNYS